MEVHRPSGGLLGRWENVVTKHSAKKMIPCDAATSEFQRRDYLKPQHLPASHIDGQANYAPAPDMNQTRFHRGFQRRHASDIQQDADRLEYQAQKELRRDMNALRQTRSATDLHDRATFNILTGEGNGRDQEFRQLGKKIINPFGSMSAVFDEHHRDMTNRVRNSKHRYFEYPALQTQPPRELTLFKEGFTGTRRQTTVLGYGHAVPRQKTESLGVSDNFTHLRTLPPEPRYEAPVDNNISQIVFG